MALTTHYASRLLGLILATVLLAGIALPTGGAPVAAAPAHDAVIVIGARVAPVLM